MEKVMTVKQFVETAEKIATDCKTLYVMGCFGAPMSDRNKKRYSSNNAYNRQPEVQKTILNASDDTFGFDCICLIKSILWGWSGDKNLIYGGAVYKSNDVPDFGTESLMKHCTDVSDDFSNIEIGEVLYLKGHAGIYKGDGKVVEATPAWENKVQITNLKDRKWLKHGKLDFVDYTKPEPVEPTPVEPEPTPVVPEPTPVVPEPIPEPVPTPKFKVGDRVKIVGAGNANSYGTGHRAGGIGWHRYITKIYEGRVYPYQVGNKGKTDSLNTTGFYKEDALEIAN